ncbi:MAG: class I SAM-dependent methyltransferase [Candidatus Caldarchaeum sp.]|nr:class I SAM-dependent methyltransferase [Candidatus Caldarchaeum sp.]
MRVPRYGLGKEWGKVVAALQNLVHVYDRLNQTISFNSDMKLRAECIDGKIESGYRVLDAGCGNGIFSRILLEKQPAVGEVVLLDALAPMLRQAVAKIPVGRTHAVLAVFEYMPFREKAFDSVLMGFSLRDAINMDAAMSEVKRVTKESGRLLVVDLGKPANIFKTFLISFYWFVLAPFFAFLRLGKVGLNASAIFTTYKRLPTNGELKKLANRFFHAVEVQEKMMGAAMIMNAQHNQLSRPAKDF